MPSKSFLLCCAIVANLALTIAAGCATRASQEEIAAAATVPLTGTEWRLTQLGDRLVNPLPAAQALALQLQSQNTRVVGFSGCNRMSGAYALDGGSLKFAQIGGTKMACTDDDRMRLEQQFLAMLPDVASWRIAGRTLELQDAQDRRLATFVAAGPED